MYAPGLQPQHTQPDACSHSTDNALPFAIVAGTRQPEEGGDGLGGGGEGEGDGGGGEGEGGGGEGDGDGAIIESNLIYI